MDTPTMKLPTIREIAEANEIGATGGAENTSPGDTIVKVLTTPKMISRNSSGTPNLESVWIPL